MGDKNIKNTNVKKKKKADIITSVSPAVSKPVIIQPELIKKKKKDI